MKGIKSTLKLAQITIKHAPFFLLYGIIDCILGVVIVLLPIGIIDKIVGYYYDGKIYKYVLIACLIVALVHYLINLTFFVLQRFYNRNYRIFAAKYEVSIFKKVSELDYQISQSSSFLNDFSRAINDGARVCVRCFWTLTEVIGSILSVATVFTIFALLDLWIIAYAIVVGTIFFFLSKYNSKLYWRLSEAQKQHYRERGYVKRMFYLKDTAEDIRTTKVKDILLDFNDQVGDKVIKNTDKYLSKRASISFASEILIKTIYPFALAFLTYITIQNKNIVAFTALTVAASSLSTHVSYLSSSLAYLHDESALGQAIFNVYNMKGNIELSGIKEAYNFSEVKVENLSFGYQEQMILKNISFSIKRGDKIAIVGENGAGKTTFVKLLLRLYDPQEGVIYYNDNNYQDLFPQSLRQHIGAVFQNFEIYALTIAENVLLREVENEEDENIVIEALKFSGLYEKVISFNKGIHTPVTKEFEKEGCEFSKGERQKLVIARVYAGNYDLIILDEPNSALDPLAEAEIYEKIMKLSNEKTIIFISHRLSTTLNADYIYLFEDGEIVEKGTHHELMNFENGKYQYMFNIQAQNYIEGIKDENN